MAADTILFCTELMGLKVYDTRGRKIGRVRDAALVPLVHPARIDRFLVGGGWAWLSVRFDQIASISLDGIRLGEEILTPYHSDEYMLRIGRDLLDQQIIDVNGRKVVRVNDVTFEIRNATSNGNGHSNGHGNGQGANGNGRNCLYILEVDVGIRSIFRRLVQGVLPSRLVRKVQRVIPPNSIRWEFCNIVEPDPQRRLRLNISHEKLEKIHPADLADIVEELGPAERGAIFESIDSEVAAEAEVRELLEFKPNTAGGMMNTEYISLHEGATVADALSALKGNEDQLESLNAVFLVDSDGRLTGTVPLARLFVASSGSPNRAASTETLIS